ncbi:tetratricopeptide repeat protein [Pontibacterium sp.]|uniref:tetratricopeptide repeat protein n=1 Tax=Pontibacterium sp. TaxID=2036026 RepID=UPI003516AFEC
MQRFSLDAVLSRKKRWPRWMVLTLIVGVTGCAATQESPDKVDDNALYEGRSTVTFSNLPEAKTAEEGIALGDQQLRAGEFDKALFMYIQAMQLDETNTEALYKIGQIHLDRGNTGKAVVAFEGVLARDSEHIYGNEALGILYLKANRYQDAHLFFTKSVQADRNRLMADKAENTENAEPQSLTEDEIASLTEQIQADKKSPAHAYNGLGVVADLKGDHDKAQSLYDVSLQINPRAAITLSNKGYSYYLSKQWSKAERAYKAALKINPKSPQAWRNLGLLYARQENYVSALTAFEQVMDSADAHNDVGYICLLEGKYDRAEYYFDKAMTLSPMYYEKAHENMKLTQRLRDSQITQFTPQPKQKD